MVEAKEHCESAQCLKLKKYIMYFVLILHSDQFKPKSHLQLIKKYIFSEGEQFPLMEFQLMLLADTGECSHLLLKNWDIY